jgi:hypothetical protein
MKDDFGYNMCRCGVCVPIGAAHECYRGESYVPYITPPTQTQLGWICPVCSVVHSPSILHCYCNIVNSSINNNTITR